MPFWYEISCPSRLLKPVHKILQVHRFAAAGCECESKWPQTHDCLRLATKDMKFCSRLCSCIPYNNRVRNCRKERFNFYGNMQPFYFFGFFLSRLAILHTHALRTSNRGSNFADCGGGTRWPVGWGTVLQTGRSRVRFLMVSLNFFIEIILPGALWPWGWPSL
jgi:hypothetical protein